jgi:hypothetical protein
VKRKLQFALQRIHNKDSTDSKALKAIGDSTDAVFKEMVCELCTSLLIHF